jgi:hypothetical protein
MTSPSVSSPARATEWGRFTTFRLIRIVVTFTAVLLLLTAGWLLVRRVGGALQEPLSGSAQVLLGGLLSSMLLAAGHIERRIAADTCAGWDSWPLLARVLLSVAALMLGAAVTLPGSSVLASSAFWLLILAGAVPAWLRFALSPRFERRELEPEPGDAVALSCGSRDAVLPWDVDRCASAECEADEEEDSEQLLPDDVLQRVVRARDQGGSEIVYGTVRCRFVDGQRQQSIHLAFCPPLQTLAHFATDQVFGPAVQIKTVVAETFGVGLEAKLTSPSKGPTEVQIQFFAFERPPGGEAE